MAFNPKSACSLPIISSGTRQRRGLDHPFYAANGFTALRADTTLEGIAQHNLCTLTDLTTPA